MRMLIFGLLVLWAGLPAGAEPFWIAYEGNDFPENEGWNRVYGDKYGPCPDGAQRWIEDGKFVIDSLESTQIFDAYTIHRHMDPEPGELFVAEWRVFVDPASDDYDPEVVIARSFQPGYVSIEIGRDSLRIRDEDVYISLGNVMYHTFRFESWDMVEYDLFVNSELVHHGLFDTPSVNESFIAFGDDCLGRKSLSKWDYFRFGTVPEPPMFVLAMVFLVVLRIR